MADPDRPEAPRAETAETPEIAALRDSFRPRLAERVAEITAEWESVRPATGNAETPIPDLLRRLHRLAHSLAGAAGTFGFPAVGDASRTLERRLENADADPTPQDSEDIALLVAALRRSAELLRR